MYKATRKLIQARQRHSKYVIEQVRVENVGGGKANDCFINACNAIDRSREIKIVSGWVVKAFDTFQNSTEIIQHFWNVDRNGNYFDTTPLMKNNAVEYVVDTDICHYGQEHIEEIDSCVASSLLLKNDKFIAVDIEDDRLNFRSIKSLSIEELFETTQ